MGICMKERLTCWKQNGRKVPSLHPSTKKYILNTSSNKGFFNESPGEMDFALKLIQNTLSINTYLRKVLESSCSSCFVQTYLFFIHKYHLRAVKREGWCR